jgi:hypothetical protein
MCRLHALTPAPVLAGGVKQTLSVKKSSSLGRFPELWCTLKRSTKSPAALLEGLGHERRPGWKRPRVRVVVDSIGTANNSLWVGIATQLKRPSFTHEAKRETAPPTGRPIASPSFNHFALCHARANAASATARLAAQPSAPNRTAHRPGPRPHLRPADKPIARSRFLPAIDRYYCTGGRTWATGEVLRALLYWVEKEPMRLDAEKAATAVMTVAIAGVGPACVALLLLLWMMAAGKGIGTTMNKD